MPKAEPGRGSRPHIENRAIAVRKILAPFCRSGAPTELTARNHVIDSRRTIPRASDVEFQIRIKGEHFTLPVDRQIDRIPKPRSNHLPVFPVRRDPADPTARRFDAHSVPHRIGHGMQQRVNFPNRRLLRRNPFRNPAVVSTHQIKRLSVLRLDHGMRRVLVAHLQFFD